MIWFKWWWEDGLGGGDGVVGDEENSEETIGVESEVESALDEVDEED